MLGDPKYSDGFSHFDYVATDAPNGGRVRLSVVGRFDNLNFWNRKGVRSAAARQCVESLMAPSLDEGSTHYGLLAEWMERPKDASWVAFRIRENARFHDGRPVTPTDCVKSLEMLVESGRPFFAAYYANVERAVDEGENIVRFHFDQTGNKELPHIMGQLDVFPAHWWEGRDFAEPILEPLLGSGPYRISEFDAGKFVQLSRVADYWGAETPTRAGQNNFDEIRFEYFFEQAAAFEAFKRGDIDYWNENRAKRWAQEYDFPAAAQGKVIKREVPLDGPKTVQAFAFNARRTKFQDRRVRQALALAFDFEWTNQAVFYEQYARPSSYFQGSEPLMATGAPSAEEVALLEPFRDQLPPELFEQAFETPATDGSGRFRRLRRDANRLLSEAGYPLQDGKRIGPDGAPFTVEFLGYQDSQRPVVDPYLRNLQLLGIDTAFRGVDAAQYQNRLLSFDFDMVVTGWANSESPGNEQRDYWGSASANVEGGRNLAGVQNPVVDALIEKIIFAPDRAALETASKALDRVLLWEHYAVLELYEPRERIAYWDRFSAPDPLPSRSVGFPAVWWWDAEKAAKL
ncbi:MAG: extracellular solute-binding protein [Pseudomonadota bacterium]